MSPTPDAQKSATPRLRHQQPATCGGCSAEWYGTAACHCAASGCHQTFTGVAAFDAHRRRGECARPESIGLVRNELGRWGRPPMTDDEKRRRFG